MDSFFLFITASLAVIVVPGPDFIYVLSRGLSGGRNQGVISAAGISAGLIFHSIAAALGLAILLQNIPGAFMLIKSAGGMYIIYLGVKSLRLKESIFPPPRESYGTNGKCFFQGFMCNVLNPKIILFFLAFLPQFVPQGNDSTALSLLSGGMIYAAVTFVLYSALGFFSGTIGTVLACNKKALAVIQKSSALILIVLGLMMFIIR